MKLLVKLLIISLGMQALPMLGMARFQGLGRIARQIFINPSNSFKATPVPTPRKSFSLSNWFKFPSVKSAFFKKPALLASIAGVSAAGSEKTLAQENADNDLDSQATKCAIEVDRQLPKPLYEYCEEENTGSAWLWKKNANPLIDQEVFKRCNITKENGPTECAKLWKEIEKKLDIKRWRQQDMAVTHESSQLFKRTLEQAGKERLSLSTIHEGERNRINHIVREQYEKCPLADKKLCGHTYDRVSVWIAKYWAALGQLSKK